MIEGEEYLKERKEGVASTVQMLLSAPLEGYLEMRRRPNVGKNL